MMTDYLCGSIPRAENALTARAIISDAILWTCLDGYPANRAISTVKCISSISCILESHKWEKGEALFNTEKISYIHTALLKKYMPHNQNDMVQLSHSSPHTGQTLPQNPNFHMHQQRYCTLPQAIHHLNGASVKRWNVLCNKQYLFKKIYFYKERRSISKISILVH